jgi:hypothetical protein
MNTNLSRLVKALRKLAAAEPAVERFLVYGPDPVDLDEAPGPLETLLSWPVRMILLAGIWIVAWTWRSAVPAQQLGWGLAYAGAIAVSLAVSLWKWIFWPNLILGGLWLLFAHYPAPRRADQPLLWIARQAVEFLNRQMSHIEALWIWTALVLSTQPKINFQLPLLGAVYLVGPPVINALAQPRDPDQPRLSKASGDLQWARRPLIYWATLLGLGLLVVRTWDLQALNLLPLALAVGVGAVFRLVRHRVRAARVGADDAQDHRAFRLAQRRFTRGADVGLGPVLVALSVVGLVLFSRHERAKLDSAVRSALDGPPPSDDACTPEQDGPVEPQLQMLLLADSQMHELGGKRFPGQMELADALVPVALRPVELDILSAAPLWRFGQHFAHLLSSRPKPAAGQPERPFYWAHLGDFADLSCAGELDRAIQLLHPFPLDHLAGIAPGNHDMSFTGNFFWSPFWNEACKSGRLDKPRSTAALQAFAGAAIQKSHGAMVEVGASPLPTWIGGRGGALVTVMPLGQVTAKWDDQDGGKPSQHAVAGIFVDTADGNGFDFGIAGLFGTFSKEQDRTLRALVDHLGEQAGPGYQDPAWLLFAHHPLAEMTDEGRERLLAFAAWLDARHAGGAPDLRPRVLALLAAHTHIAETHRYCAGPRSLREIVIGSTIDPPQQAALLQVGANADGQLSVRVRTLPAVGRPGYTCGESETLLAAQRCRGIMAGLRATPACAPLFQTDDAGARDCGALERPLTTQEQLEAAATQHQPVDPDEIKSAQNLRAGKLMTCICREKGPTPGAPAAGGAGHFCTLPPQKDADEGKPYDYFKDEAYHQAILQRLGSPSGPGVPPAEAATAGPVASPQPEDEELVCLAWAAAAMQQHKVTGMTFAEALRCAYDDTSLPPAQESVATLEARACP